MPAMIAHTDVRGRSPRGAGLNPILRLRLAPAWLARRWLLRLSPGRSGRRLRLTPVRLPGGGCCGCPRQVRPEVAAAPARTAWAGGWPIPAAWVAGRRVAVSRPAADNPAAAARTRAAGRPLAAGTWASDRAAEAGPPRAAPPGLDVRGRRFRGTLVGHQIPPCCSGCSPECTQSGRPRTDDFPARRPQAGRPKISANS